MCKNTNHASIVNKHIPLFILMSMENCENFLKPQYYVIYYFHCNNCFFLIILFILSFELQTKITNKIQKFVVASNMHYLENEKNCKIECGRNDWQ